MAQELQSRLAPLVEANTADSLQKGLHPSVSQGLDHSATMLGPVVSVIHSGADGDTFSPKCSVSSPSFKRTHDDVRGNAGGQPSGSKFQTEAVSSFTVDASVIARAPSM